MFSLSNGVLLRMVCQEGCERYLNASPSAGMLRGAHIYDLARSWAAVTEAKAFAAVLGVLAGEIICMV